MGQAAPTMRRRREFGRFAAGSKQCKRERGGDRRAA
jgi:hypothetical protein